MVNQIYAAGVLALGLTSMAQAEEHLVVVTGLSYFPTVVYAHPGDSVRFVNTSGQEQIVVGKDTGWTVGPLANFEEGTLDITEETELQFFAAYENDGESYGEYSEAPIKAEISFDEPPLDG